jgi:hypothetical protein
MVLAVTPSETGPGSGRAGHPRTKPEILTALESNARTLATFFSALPAPVFFDGDSDHWGPGHHLVHLTQASVAMERALRSPARACARPTCRH